MKSVGRRSLALILSVLMTLSLISTVSFAEGNVAADAQNQEADKQVVQEVQPDAAEAPAAVAEDKTEAEAKQPAAPVEKAFSQSKIVDGVKVAVTADKGVFPADAQLSVTKVAVPAAVDTKDAAKAYAFDITILAGGKKIQPDGRANVSFTTAEVAQYDTDVYHMAGAAAQKMSDSENGNTTSVSTKSFSVYVMTLTVKINEGDAETKTANVTVDTPYSYADILTMAGITTTPDPTQYRSNFSDAAFAGIIETSTSEGVNYVTFKAATTELTTKPYLRVANSEDPTKSDAHIKIEVAERFKVTFNAGDGTMEEADKTQLVPADNQSKATEPSVTPPAGQTLIGWFNGGTKFNFAETVITEDINLTAKYGYKVTFDAGDGELAEGTVNPQLVEAGGKATSVTPTAPEGQTFMGWFNEGTEFNFAETVINEDINLTAKYGYKVTFDAGDGELAEGTANPQLVEAGGNATEPSVTPPEGKALAGWFNGGDKFSFNTPITSDLTLVAQYQDPVTKGWDVTYNEDHSVATLTRVDPDPELNGKSYTVTMTAEDTYYDVAEGRYKGADYKVAAVDGEEVPAEVKALIGAKVGSKGKRYCNPNKLKTGGMGYLDLTANPLEYYWAKVYLPEDKDTTGQDEYVYAKFHLYYVNVEMNVPTGGFVEDDNQDLVEKAEVKPANDAAAFVYSVDSETGPFSDEAKNTGYKEADNPHSLYYKVIPTDSNADALFGPAKAGEFNVTERTTYQVTFNTDGGAPVPEAQPVPAGGKATAPTETVTKNGFTFDGWFLGTATTPFDFTNTEITGNIELKARWTPVHNLTVDTVDGKRRVSCDIDNCPYKENPVLIEAVAKDVYYAGHVTTSYKITGEDPDKLVNITDTPKYYKGDTLVENCTEPGKYNVRYEFTVKGKEWQGQPILYSAVKLFDVVKATVEPNGTGTDKKEFTYGENKEMVKTTWDASQGDFTIKYKAVGVDNDYTSEFSESIPNAKDLDAGTYNVLYEVYDGETKVDEGTVENLLIKAQVVKVTKPTAKLGMVYDTTEQELITAGALDPDLAEAGITLQYAAVQTGTADSYSAEIPKGKDAGTYKIYYYPVKGGAKYAGKNYVFVDATSEEPIEADPYVEAKIAKADPMDTENGAVEPEGVNVPYNGEGQKLVEKDTGKTVDYEDAPPILYSLSKDDGYGETIPTGTDAKNYIVYWKVVGNDNYENASGQFTSKIYQEEYLTPPVAAEDLVYNGSDKQLLSKAAVLGEEAPEGAQIVYAVTGSDTPPAADEFSSPYDSGVLPAETVGTDAGEYYIWYKVVKEDADLTPADYVVAEIDKAEAEFTEEPTAKSSEYAGKNRWLTTKGSTEDGKIYFSFDGEEYSTNRPGAIDADEYTIWYYIKGDKNHYDSEPATLNAEITPRVVILNWLGENEDPNDFDYIYDGTEKQPTATVKNLVTREDTGKEDVVTVTVGGGQTNVGEYTGENGAEAIALGGADVDNYQLPEDAYHDFNIIPQVVTIKWYGENDSETDFAYTYNGEEQGPTAKAFVGDEEVARLYVFVDGWETNASDSPYTATATELSNDNYALPEEGLTKEFTIAKKPVTIDNINAKDKVYDGKKAAQMDGTPNINGKVGNDNVYVKSATMAFADKNAGSNKTVNISAVELGGEAAGNYDVSDFQKKTTASITPLKANLKWYGENGSEEDFDYIYNGKKQCPTAEVTNLQKDDEDATDDVAVTVTGAQKNAGEHNATAAALTGDDKDNYEIKNDAHEFTISPKEVRVVWVPDTTEFVYDGKDHEPLAYVNPDDVVEGDDPDDLDVYQEGSSHWMIDVGNYTVNATGLYDYYGNYVLKKDDPSLTFTFTITQRTAELAWDPDPAEYTYDGKPHVPTATVANLVQSRRDTGKPDTCTVTVDGAQKDAGAYTATAAALSNRNYKLPDNLDDKTFAFKINPREVEIEWSNTEFTYDGKEHVPTATVKNPVEGEVLAATVETPQKDAGTYPATVTGLTPTETAKNYKLPDPAPTTQFTIKERELTATASDQTIYYGEDFDKTKVTYSGWAEGDDESKLETPATVTSNYFVNAKAGTYKLTPDGAAAKNYTVKYVDGKLTVKNKVTWLVAKAASQGSKRGRLSWNKVTGAKTYEVWFARCNSKTKKFPMKKVATVKGNSYTKGGLKKGVCYKYYVIAKDAKGKRIAKSLDAHFAVGNNNRAGTNCKTLTVNKTSVSLAAGKTFTIKAKQTGYVAKKRLLDGTHTALCRYTSTNKAVATVNAKGKITAVGKGYCQVYVQACNGLWKAINVTVK